MEPRHPNQELENQIRKAAVLIEALPYMQQFRGHTFVIKVGGSAMENEDLVRKLLRDVVFLEIIGINPVIVHGGGKFISAAMAERGLEPRWVAGPRVTDADSIRIVEKTLAETINPSLVDSIHKYGGQAVGLPGKEVFIAERAKGKADDGTEVDLGYVGKIVDFALDEVETAIASEQVPVLSPLATERGSENGLPLNVNADLAASALAGRLRATKLIYLSDVLGVMRDPGDPSSLIHSVDEPGIEELIRTRVISGGMIPKVRSSLDALHDGVRKVHLIDGRIPHSLLLEIFTDVGVGTEIFIQSAS